MSNRAKSTLQMASVVVLTFISVLLPRIGAFATNEDASVYKYRDMFNPVRYISFAEYTRGINGVWGHLSYSRSDAYEQLTDCSLNSEGICIDWSGVWRFAYDCSSFDEDGSIVQEWRSEDWVFSVSPPKGAASEYLIIARRDKYEAGAMENIEMQFIWSKAKGVTELIFLSLDDQFQRKGIVNVWRALDVGFGQFEKICK